MSGFTQSCLVETEAMADLLPFLEQKADDGRLVLCSKGALAKHLQQSIGDALMNRNGQLYSVEIKAERRHTKNLFLETWSNKNLNDRASHAERGCNPGWMVKLKADLLMYYFLDEKLLYVIDFFALQQWAFGCNDTQGQIYAYREVRQNKYSQGNDTWGRIVPIKDIYNAIGLQWFYLNKLHYELNAA